MIRHLRFGLLLAVVAHLHAARRELPAQAAPRADGAPLRNFDAYVERAMRDWEVPGVAIAVVKDDSIVLARGYGVRGLGTQEPVDAHTLFAIASASKAFTATLMGMLVDEGKVRWDDHVIRHLPGFELFDPYVTRELTIRDLLSHRSGIARGDLVWYATDLPDTMVVRRVRYLRPSWSLRSQFGYQNIMYLAAGQVLSRASGRTWAQLVRERIFQPLGMAETNTSVGAFRGNANVAQPHEKIDDTLRVIPWRNWDNVAAAGAINSNVADMAKWVRFQLDSGRVRGTRLITSAALEETHTPHTIIRRDARAREMYPVTNFSLYGMGWFLSDHRGREVVEHGGNLDGMSSEVALLPSERLGVVILTNMDGTGLRDVLWRKIFDLYLGAPDKDWSTDVLKVRRKQLAEAKEQEKKVESQRVAGTKPSLRLEQYAGTYSDSLYGDVAVGMEAGALVARFGPSFVGPLEHWHFDTFRARWRDRALGKSFLTFTLGPDAKVQRLTLENAGDFRRDDKVDTTAAVALTAAERQRLLGNYKVADQPQTASVELVGGTLRFILPGQDPYTLVAVTAERFKLARPNMPPGYFVQFALERNRVTKVTLEQPAPRPTVVYLPVAP